MSLEPNKDRSVEKDAPNLSSESLNTKNTYAREIEYVIAATRFFLGEGPSFGGAHSSSSTFLRMMPSPFRNHSLLVERGPEPGSFSYKIYDGEKPSESTKAGFTITRFGDVQPATGTSDPVPALLAVNELFVRSLSMPQPIADALRAAREKENRPWWKFW